MRELFNYSSANFRNRYLDESGDLGWTFDRPYRQGGSMVILNLAALCVPSAKKHIPKKCPYPPSYTRFKWSPQNEKKWVDMSPESRQGFANAALKMCQAHNDIFMHAMVVRKENVGLHIRRDANKLYDYTTGFVCSTGWPHLTRLHWFPIRAALKLRAGTVSLNNHLELNCGSQRRSRRPPFQPDE